jgi:hypothetical protein
LIKDTDNKLLFDDLDSPTKSNQTNLREKKVHIQKVKGLYLIDQYFITNDQYF